MSLRLPSFFLLVPGPFRTPSDVVAALAQRGIHAKPRDGAALVAKEIGVEVIEDANLVASFGWGRRGRLPADVVALVGRHTRAALIEYGGRLDEHPAAVAALGRALRDAGGVAVRMEASGAASPWDPWIAQLASGEPAAVYASAVVLVGGERGSFFTCGMHQFDLADAEISVGDAREAAEWLDAFCVYRLAEQPGLASGHVFRPNEEATPRAFARWPDAHHVPTDGRYNPFGIWRLREPGAGGPTGGKLAPTIIPPLVTVLLASERKKGEMLTQREVAEIVSRSPAIAMDPRDVLALERSRGYADLEPELAWEQWQIARRQL